MMSWPNSVSDHADGIAAEVDGGQLRLDQALKLVRREEFRREPLQRNPLFDEGPKMLKSRSLGNPTEESPVGCRDVILGGELVEQVDVLRHGL
jgi:hypothetical protein